MTHEDTRTGVLSELKQNIREKGIEQNSLQSSMTKGHPNVEEAKPHWLKL